MKNQHDIRTKLKRQIEILGLCAASLEPVKPVDLAVLFDCEELTVKRDLNELRSYGVDIHSVPKRGICLERPIDQARTAEMITQYVSLSTHGTLTDKATRALVKKQKAHALRNIVLFQRSIESRNVVRVDYEKTAGNIEKGKELSPARLFQADGQWRVIAKNDGILKQFLIIKMVRTYPTEKRFSGIPKDDVDALFSNSFRAFLGTESFIVRLWLSEKWAGLIKPRQLLEDAETRENKDGSCELRLTTNNLEEIAGWVVSRGEGIIVLEPEKLRTMVIGLAKGSLRNYREYHHSNS